MVPAWVLRIAYCVLRTECGLEHPVPLCVVRNTQVTGCGKGELTARVRVPVVSQGVVGIITPIGPRDIGPATEYRFRLLAVYFRSSSRAASATWWTVSPYFSSSASSGPDSPKVSRRPTRLISVG
jgi:hypothetical protein